MREDCAVFVPVVEIFEFNERPRFAHSVVRLHGLNECLCDYGQSAYSISSGPSEGCNSIGTNEIRPKELLGVETNREVHGAGVGVGSVFNRQRHGGVVKNASGVVGAIAQDQTETRRYRFDESEVEIFARSIRIGLGVERYGFGLDIGADFFLKDTEMYFCPLE